MAATQQTGLRVSGKVFVLGTLLLLALLVGAVLVFWPESGRRAVLWGAADAPKPVSEPDAAFFAQFGKSPTCQSCHEEAYANWENSHHARAERNIQTNLDAIAFDPPWKITHGTQTSFARATNGQFQVVTLGPEGKVEPFPAARVLGVSPLQQFLVPFPGGRVQMTALGFDPRD